MRALNLLEQLQMTHDDAISWVEGLGKSGVANRFPITIQILRGLERNVLDYGFKWFKIHIRDSLSNLQEFLPEAHLPLVRPLERKSEGSSLSWLGEIQPSIDFQTEVKVRQIYSMA